MHQPKKLSELAGAVCEARHKLAKALQLHGDKAMRKTGDQIEVSCEGYNELRDYMKAREILAASDEPDLVKVFK